MTEPGRDKDPFAGDVDDPPQLARGQRRTRTLVKVMTVAVVLVVFAVSTARQSTPSGGASSMGGMDMSGSDADMIGVTFRDIDGRQLALPGGTRGAVLFMSRRGCPDCPKLARSLVEAAADVTPSPTLTLVGTNPVETPADFRAFDRAAGGLDVRYALDDRGGSVADQLGARVTGTVVVYDRDGMVRERARPGPQQAAAVDRALHRGYR